MIDQTKLYINGQWVESLGHRCIEVANPADRTPLGRIPAANPADADLAVAAAAKAAESWRCTPIEKRAEYLTRIHAGLTTRSEEIAALITDEVGMPIKLSRRIQAGLPISVLESYIQLLSEYRFEHQLGSSRVIREPVGVVACITPWNYPLHQVIAKVAPALAAGCTVVLKPSEQAPLSAFLLADVIYEAGLPAGVFNLVSGTGKKVGETLAAHPGVDMVSFTGSLRAGQRVAELAAASVKRTTLELGGKSAAIILEDADLAAAVKSIVAGCFLNSGQTCNALTRMLVPEHLYEKVVSLTIEAAIPYVPGDPRNEKTRLGPLVSAAQRERVCGYIRQGITEGAELLLGGTEVPRELEGGHFLLPTIFGKVSPDMTIAREEIFGPVLSIMTCKDQDDAVAIANGTSYGLAAAVWSGDDDSAVRIAKRLKAGQVDINGGAFNLMAPFGGCKQSGYGRELGPYGLEEYLTTKSLQYNKQ